ncbi:MAG: M4 family metallopeptidase, partial [Actinobacteria bacterium]|nr:M4 family metallopeptidase [Actinomycetota bacterium]
PVLIGAPVRHGPTLVWRTEVTSGGDDPMRELVLVDATTGGVALHFDQIAHARDRRICDRSNVVNPDEVCVAPYTRVEGDPPTGTADVDSVYTYSGNVYDYFSGNFGRDGLDGAGMPLISTVRYCPTFFECPYNNAVWTGSQMVMGEGFFADDVVGHEFAHAVTERESNLFYYFQAGAINESLSDVFGELLDLGNGLGNDSPEVRWIMGEDIGSGAVRNMANPPAFFHPDSMESSNYWTGYGDNGGVHQNSGVNNKAAFLMTDGGTFNGITVTGLGTTKVGHIYYEANANLLVSGSDFKDLFQILPQACLNKVGTAGITVANCTEVERAVSATKMNQPVQDGGALEAPICNTAVTPTDLFVDNMENPASGNWTFAGGDDGWAYDIGYATSGVRSLYTPGPEVARDLTATRTGAVVPPVGATTYLWFNHSYDLEGNYDGGVVEYSTNGGGSWTDAGPLFVNNGYNRTNNEGPLVGRQVFSDFSAGYGSSRLNLSSLAGQSLRFRFRVATDSSVGTLGWLIDDVRVYTCATAAGTGTTGVSSNSAEPGDAISVSATGVASASSPYRMRMGNSAASCNTSPLLLGGAVNSTAGFNIPTVQRIIPVNSTSGVRWLCWVATGNTTNHSVPAQVTIV